MKKLLGTTLLAFACVMVAAAQTNPPAATAPPHPVSTAATLKQLETDWLDAIVKVDIAKLSAIIADDWTVIGPDGSIRTKKQLLDDTKSGAFTLKSFEMGPMDVVLYGTVAVVQGSDTETSSYNGKDTSGKYAWMDVFAKRNGKWLAVRSQIAKVG